MKNVFLEKATGASTLPLFIRQRKKIYWIGVFIPLIGMISESLGIAHAFVISGVLLLLITFPFNMAASTAARITEQSNEIERNANTKLTEVCHHALRLEFLIEKARNQGNRKLLAKLEKYKPVFETGSIEIAKISEDLRSDEHRYRPVENEIKHMEWAFSISGCVITALGSFLSIPQLL